MPIMPANASPDPQPRTQIRYWLRYAWPILLLLGILWFPFDWLSTAWPAFGIPFRKVFQNAHDHFIGHTVFFLVIGCLILAYVPALRQRPQWYALGLVLAALMQESIQAFARGDLPTFNDWNAFKGDALGGISAFLLSRAILLLHRFWRAFLGA
jgi:hypothetical protein